MKKPLLDKIDELRAFAEKKPDVLPDNGMRNIVALEERIRLMPVNDVPVTSGDQYQTLLDQATSLELEFENTHPHLSAIIREIIRLLTASGI